MGSCILLWTDAAFTSVNLASIFNGLRYNNRTLFGVLNIKIWQIFSESCWWVKAITIKKKIKCVAVWCERGIWCEKSYKNGPKTTLAASTNSWTPLAYHYYFPYQVCTSFKVKLIMCPKYKNTHFRKDASLKK